MVLLLLPPVFEVLLIKDGYFPRLSGCCLTLIIDWGVKEPYVLGLIGGL